MFNSYRRAYARISFESSAEISTVKARGISTILTDLSAGGAGLVVNFPFDAMEKVEIQIKPSILFKDVLRKSARVAWCKKLSSDLWNVGLDFGADNLLNFS
jgi:c-di-GMP-binding flagellar brake protein YcgR